MSIDVNIEKAAEEIKKYIEEKKFDCVDYSYINIEIYPPLSENDYPELTKFAGAWLEFFERSDKEINDVEEEPGQLTFSEVLEKYNPELNNELRTFDDLTAKTASLVNDDEKFWGSLRDIILPLYEKSPHYEAWKERWKSISLSYDPTPMQVKTTQMWTNQKTGERTRGEVISDYELPAGFIIKIN